MDVEERFAEAFNYMDSRKMCFNLIKAEELMRELAKEGYYYAYPFMYIFEICNKNEEKAAEYLQKIRAVDGFVADNLIIACSDPNRNEWNEAIERLKTIDFSHYYCIEYLVRSKLLNQ